MATTICLIEFCLVSFYLSYDSDSSDTWVMTSKQNGESGKHNWYIEESKMNKNEGQNFIASLKVSSFAYNTTMRIF